MRKAWSSRRAHAATPVHHACWRRGHRMAALGSRAAAGKAADHRVLRHGHHFDPGPMGRCTREAFRTAFRPYSIATVRPSIQPSSRSRCTPRVANTFKNRSSKIGSRKLPARDPQEREQACRCNAYQRLHLLVAGLHHLRECPWRPSCDTIKRDFFVGPSPVERSSSKPYVPL